MKIEVAKQDLDAALSVVSHSISSSGADLSTHFLFRAIPGDDKKAEVRTHTGRVYSGCPFVAAVTTEDDGPKAFTIDGWRLKQYLGAIDDCALTFEFDGTVTTVTDPGGSIRLKTLDPDGFPHWDKNIEDAKVTATMTAERLAAALDFSRSFASDDPSKSPHLCVCEVLEGVIASSDKQVGTYLTVPGLSECNIRVFAKDAPGILAFLNQSEGDIEVLEHDRHAFFRRTDGAVFGESRYLVQFPRPKRPPIEDAFWWDFSVNDLKRAMSIMKAAADKEDIRILLKPVDDSIEVSMLDATGKRTARTIPCTEQGKQEVADGEKAPDPMPDDGFLLPSTGLTRFFSLWNNDTIRFGINPRGKRGYTRIEDVRFASEDGTDEGDTYVTVLAWLQ